MSVKNQLDSIIYDLGCGDYERIDGGHILLPKSKFKVGGWFTHEVIRRGRSLGAIVDPNLIVNEGLNHILDVVFHGSTQQTTWYVSIFKGNVTPTAGWTQATYDSTATEATEYDESTRPEYEEAASSSQSITNSANRATFSINSSITAYGAALHSESTKQGTSEVLMAATRFSSSRALVDDDELLITYTINASSS